MELPHFNTTSNPHFRIALYTINTRVEGRSVQQEHMKTSSSLLNCSSAIQFPSLEQAHQIINPAWVSLWTRES